MTSQALFKHDMQLTSLDAFHKLPACPLTVLRVFAKPDEKTGQLRALSSHQVAKELGWEICSVSGRITDLRKRFGFLEYYSVGVRSNGCSEKILTITKSGLQWLNDRRD
jgi:hypothetical protein